MYVLHNLRDSAGLAVHVMLLELEQPFLMTVIDREADTRDRHEYRALHPFGQVPALETPDGPIFETAAILLWLADRHGGGMAPAPNSHERGQFLKWLFFTSTNLHATVMGLFYPDRYTGDPAANPAFLRRTVRRTEEALEQLEKAVARHPSWCPPDRPSALGIYLGVMLRWIGPAEPGARPLVETAAYPALRSVARMIEDRPAARAAARAEGLGATIFTAPAA
jgi:glutathione S-transferase